MAERPPLSEKRCAETLYGGQAKLTQAIIDLSVRTCCHFRLIIFSPAYDIIPTMLLSFIETIIHACLTFVKKLLYFSKNR